MPDPSVSQNVSPPCTVSLLWCPVCGRDDRYKDLKEGAGRHFRSDGRCPGTPAKLTYVLNERAERINDLIVGI